MKKFWKNNSLSIVLIGLFVIFVIGQTITGFQVNNKDMEDHNQPTISMAEYLGGGHFGEAIFENWESEFLQMASYIILTAFLFQRGSAESKNPDVKNDIEQGANRKTITKNSPWPVRKGGIWLKLYRNSLFLVFVFLFLMSFALHAVEGSRENCSQGLMHGQKCETFTEYVTGPQFWFESFQNWQSEYLAVASIVLLSIFLRQQGSPESKPLTSPNSTTG
ncbi:MAG: hypothetical protein JWO54_947 [Candidatus Saccharibacteria bacterium]|nr:hypothetical protein [Candidatus Saccharibacteria bacterium]MDB5181184.1 hypothetical protein [Candidatus Saccharibacteria bacterium]